MLKYMLDRIIIVFIFFVILISCAYKKVKAPEYYGICMGKNCGEETIRDKNFKKKIIFYLSLESCEGYLFSISILENNKLAYYTFSDKNKIKYYNVDLKKLRYLINFLENNIIILASNHISNEYIGCPFIYVKYKDYQSNFHCMPSDEKIRNFFRDIAKLFG